ncbi:hypothetical protein GALL_474360 [mine drainage metagenome]|uniref:Uncharacterized protein n=1 Tax=mine drainage metagenome TaxID=410659 RepID=A0A1J5PTN6_9ZZZZ
MAVARGFGDQVLGPLRHAAMFGVEKGGSSLRRGIHSLRAQPRQQVPGWTRFAAVCSDIAHEFVRLVRQAGQRAVGRGESVRSVAGELQSQAGGVDVSGKSHSGGLEDLGCAAALLVVRQREARASEAQILPILCGEARDQ